MNAEERAKKNVEAAVKRFADGRLVAYFQPAEDAGMSVLSAADAVKKKWKPVPEELLDRTLRRVGLEDAPSDYDCCGMEAVVWHMQEMVRGSFNDELRRRGLEKPERERWLRLLSLVKETT